MSGKYLNLKFEHFEKNFRLSKGVFGGGPIFHKGRDYRICILKSELIKGPHVTQSFEYFEADNDGKIFRCPHGKAKEYKGAVIMDIAEAFKRQQEGLK